MRHLAAVLLVSLAAVACGGISPETTDPTATTASDLLINPNPGPSTCTSGYYYQCHAMPSGMQLCGCEALSCNWEYPAPTSAAYRWIESYEVASSDGSCPDLKAPTGTWKNLSISNMCSPGYGFEGVPCETSANPPNLCNPADFGSGTQHCCTYVWWPTGYSVPTACTEALCPAGTPDQFPQALCAHAGTTIRAIAQTNCTPEEMDGGKCQLPGKGTCSTCGQLP